MLFNPEHLPNELVVALIVAVVTAAGGCCVTWAIGRFKRRGEIRANEEALARALIDGPQATLMVTLANDLAMSISGTGSIILGAFYYTTMNSWINLTFGGLLSGMGFWSVIHVTNNFGRYLKASRQLRARRHDP